VGNEDIFSHATRRASIDCRCDSGRRTRRSKELRRPRVVLTTLLSYQRVNGFAIDPGSTGPGGRVSIDDLRAGPEFNVALSADRFDHPTKIF
jgi:hypothetical protein